MGCSDRARGQNLVPFVHRVLMREANTVKDEILQPWGLSTSEVLTWDGARLGSAVRGMD